MKEWRGSRPYVFTKCVKRWDEKGRVTTVFNRDSIRRECDDSLRRLQVNVIDLYQIHWPPANNGPGTGRSLANNGRPAKRRKGPVDQRLEFHHRADRARGENCAGPADGDNAKLIGAIARHLERNGARIRFVIVPVDDLAQSAKALEQGRGRSRRHSQ
jgi:Aldo/keto reductase family